MFKQATCGLKTWLQSDIVTRAIDRTTLAKHLKTMAFVDVQPSELHKQS